MAFRRLLRGTVSESDRQAVAAEVAQKYDLDGAAVRSLEAENWLSTPLVVEEEVFVKLITPQNALVHTLLTAGRNLGAFSSGTEGFFEHADTPLEMAQRELTATRRMRELGVNAPDPLEAFEHGEYGVLVLEYLPEFRSLDELSAAAAEPYAVSLFEALSRMHEANLVHGDLRAENVLIADGDLYFIDATTVRTDGIADARAYDLACALAVLAPIVGPAVAVGAAAEVYDPGALLAADEFLDFVSLRPDHDFEVPAIRGEIEKLASDGS